MKNTNTSFGSNLRKEINRKHLKYAEAAELFDISLGFLNQLMKGMTSPSLEVYRRIVEKLDISADALMFGDSRPVIEKEAPLDLSQLSSMAQMAAALTELNKKVSNLAPQPPMADVISAAKQVGITHRSDYKEALTVLKSKLKERIKDGVPRPNEIDGIVDDVFPEIFDHEDSTEDVG